MRFTHIAVGASAFALCHLLLWWSPVSSGVVRGTAGTMRALAGKTTPPQDLGSADVRALFAEFSRLGFTPADLARRQEVMRALCALDPGAACDAFETLPYKLREAACANFCKMVAEVNPGAADIVLRRLSRLPKEQQYALITPLCMWHPKIIEGIGDDLHLYQHIWASSRSFDSRLPLNSMLGLMTQPEPNDRGSSVLQFLRRANDWPSEELEAAVNNATDTYLIKTLRLALAIQQGSSGSKAIDFPKETNPRMVSLIELFASPRSDNWSMLETFRDEEDIKNHTLKTAINLGISDPRWQNTGIKILNKYAQEESEVTARPARYFATNFVEASVSRGLLPENEIAEIIKALPEGDVKDRGLNTLISSWIDRDPEGATTFVANHPETRKHNLSEFYEKLATNALDSPQDAAVLALMMPDYKEGQGERPSRTHLISQILYSAEINEIDPMVALRQAEAETGSSFLESERARFGKENDQ